jgi:hypothetical protein
MSGEGSGTLGKINLSSVMRTQVIFKYLGKITSEALAFYMVRECSYLHLSSVMRTEMLQRMYSVYKGSLWSGQNRNEK